MGSLNSKELTSFEDIKNEYKRKKEETESKNKLRQEREEKSRIERQKEDEERKQRKLKKYNNNLDKNKEKALKLVRNICSDSIEKERGNHARFHVQEDTNEYVYITGTYLVRTVNLSLNDFIELMKKEFGKNITFNEMNGYTSCKITFEN